MSESDEQDGKSRGNRSLSDKRVQTRKAGGSRGRRLVGRVDAASFFGTASQHIPAQKQISEPIVGVREVTSGID